MTLGQLPRREPILSPPCWIDYPVRSNGGTSWRPFFGIPQAFPASALANSGGPDQQDILMLATQSLLAKPAGPHGASMRYAPLSAATSAPFAVVVKGSDAIRISESSIGKSDSRSSFSNRSAKPAGTAVPPLNTSGIGLEIFGRLREPGKSVAQARHQRLNHIVVVDGQNLLQFVLEMAINVERLLLQHAHPVGAFPGHRGRAGVDKIPSLRQTEVSTGTERYEKQTLQSPPPQLIPMPV